MKKILKKIAVLLSSFALILLVGVVFTACGEKENTTPPADASTHVSSISDFKSALAKGGAITLDADIKDVEEELVLTKDVSIDLNGKTISSKENFMYSDEGPWSLFTIKGASVTISGNGTIDAKGLFVFTVQSEYQGKTAKQNEGIKSSKLTIENGTFIDNEAEEGTIVYILGKGSTCEIKGGTFKLKSDDKTWMLNTLDESERENGKSNFSVTGGTFEGFDPSATNLTDQNKSHDFHSHVADGYKVEKDNNNFKVVKAQ